MVKLRKWHATAGRVTDKPPEKQPKPLKSHGPIIVDQMG